MINPNECKFIHYGANKYNPLAFKKVQNTRRIKPKGGLWASPTHSNWGWSDWCESEEFMDCTIDNCFEFELAKNANVLVIDVLEDLQKIPLVEQSKMDMYFMPIIDFELMASSYDAMFLTEKGLMITRHNRPLSLNGWDCESICIFNADVIIIKND